MDIFLKCVWTYLNTIYELFCLIVICTAFSEQTSDKLMLPRNRILLFHCSGSNVINIDFQYWLSLDNFSSGGTFSNQMGQAYIDGIIYPPWFEYGFNVGSRSKVLYMSFDRFLLAIESRDLSQADKSIIRVSSFPKAVFEW